MTRQEASRRNAAIARARKDVDRALASLRELLPKGLDGAVALVVNDEVLFQLRDKLLTPVTVAPPIRPRGGRPWEWKQDTEQALRELRVPAAARQELIAALGFVDDDPPPE